MANEYIICGFSGIGKSTAEQKNRRILDFESTPYSRIFENGIDKGRNPDFPRNYIDKLCELIDNNEAWYYLLSCHQEVRDELKRRGLNYIIVLPFSDEKNEYIKRWFKRGSSIDFIKIMDEKWYSMHKSCEEDSAPKLFLEKDEYISDLICI